MYKIHFLWCWMLVSLTLAVSAQAELPDFIRSKMGYLGGQVYVDGKIQPQVVIAFFNEKNGHPPLSEGMGRVPEFLFRTDSAGEFNVNLPAGQYYVGILIRNSRGAPGPPRLGEKFYFAVNDRGGLLLVSVAEQERQEVGRINGAPHWSFTDPTMYFKVTGVIRKEKGEPVANVVVLGKSRLNIPRPEYISARTSSDGTYSLKLPANISYYLMARQDIAASRPKPGSLVGTYGIHSKIGLATLNFFSNATPPSMIPGEGENSRAMTVSGREGETRSGVDIYMYPVPDPEVMKKSVQSSVTSQLHEKIPNNQVYFEGKSGRLSAKSLRDLEQWVAFLLSKDEVDIELVGYTDNLGTTAANFSLTEKQARIVAEYFVVHGVSAERIKVAGMGALNPVANNRNNAGRAKNRRVEIKILGADN